MSSKRRLSINPVGPALGGLAALLTLIGLLTLRQSFDARQTQAQIGRVREVANDVSEVAIALRDAETGQRGYLLTGDPEYLTPYQTAIDRLPGLCEDLRRLAADSPRELGQVAQLASLVQPKLNELAQTIALRTEFGEDAAKKVIVTNLGRHLMRRVETKLAELAAEEDRALADRRAAMDRAEARVQGLALAGSATAVLLLGSAALLHRLEERRRRRLEARVRESEAEFRIIAEHATEMVSRTGADGMRVYVSPAGARIFGVPTGALLERGLLDYVRTEDRSAVQECWRTLLSGAVEEAGVAFRVCRPDGEERWVEGAGRVVRDASTGAPAGYVSVSRDVTERKRTEALLRESDAMYRLIADNTSDVITCVDLAHRRTYVSPSCRAMFGCEPEEMLGDARALMHADDLQQVGDVVNPLAAGAAEQGNMTYRLRHRDGRWIWVEATLTLVRDAAGAPASLVCSLRDVSRRKEQNEELLAFNVESQRLTRHLTRARDVAERASQAKSRFLAGMSHELRTPLNGLLGYTQLLHLEGGLSARQSQRVDAMLGAGSHLLQMINQVLELSEVEADHAEAHMSETDLHLVVHACLELVRPGADAKGLALDLDEAEGAPRRLTTDPTRLRQILLNLLGNAVKFTATGAVTLRLDATGETGLRIEVADTGPGVPAAHRTRLFQDFERIGADVAMIEGAGLGLALSARLATMLGGRIGHEDNPGGGSVFWLELPQGGEAGGGAAPSRPSPAAQSEAAEEQAAGQLRVLVVDDIAMNRDIAGCFLRAACHEVVSADSGAAAIEAANTEDFDVILMDVRMPEMDGLEATRRIRALPGPRGRIPIVALTAQAFTEQIAECRKAGMDAHLAKPFKPEALLAVLTQAVAAGRARSAAVHAPAADQTPVGLPGAAAAHAEQAGGAEWAVFDAVAFERTAAFLSPETVASSLRTIAERGESLLQALRNPDPLTRVQADLAAAAHTLAGSAGMFGFSRVANVGSLFERAVQTGDPGSQALADKLVVSVEELIDELRARVSAVTDA